MYVMRRLTTREITFARTNRASKETMPAGTKVLVSEKPMANGKYVARVTGTMLQAYVQASDFEEAGA